MFQLRNALITPPLLPALLTCLAMAMPLCAGSNASSTYLTTSANPATYGQVLTISATVTSGATGKVTFYDGVTVLGIASIAGSQAALRTPLLPAGTRQLRAYYGGDTVYAASTSPEFRQTVAASASAGFKKPGYLQMPAAPGASAYASALTVNDFNGDGRPDVAVVYRSQAKLGVMPGNGLGGFALPVECTIGGTGQAITAADFNGDGKADLAVATSAGLSILAGAGDGTFAPATNIALTGLYYGVVAGDFNGDGNVDLAAASDGVLVLLGNGNGTFRNPARYAAGRLFGTIMAADFNGDGKADLAGLTSYYVAILRGNGDGSFQNANTYGNGWSWLYRIAVADWNGDGKADVAVSGEDNAISLFSGIGDGTLPQEPTVINRYSYGLTPGDFNGDGRTDLLSNDDNGTAVLFGAADGTLLNPASYILSLRTAPFVTGDFDGDGTTDALAATEDPCLALLAGGAVPDLTISSSHRAPFTRGQTGAFYTLAVTNAGDVPSSGTVGLVDFLPSGLTATDIAGDGWTCVTASATCTRSDSLAADASYPPVRVTVNVAADAPASVTNVAVVTASGDRNPANNTASDATQVRAAASTTLASSANPATLGQPVTFTATVTAGATGNVTFYDSATVLGAAALAGGRAAFTTALLPSGARAVWALYNGDATYGPGASATLSQVVSAGASAGFRSISAALATETGDERLVTADFNGDGKTDVARYRSYYSPTGRKYLYVAAVSLGRGNGTFQPATEFNLESSADILVAADFNQDGKTDLAGINGYFQSSVLAGKGDGTFQAAVAQSLTLPDRVYAAVAADFDGDGLTDLALSGSDTLNVLLGKGDLTFQSPLRGSGGRLLGVGDFNADGKADLVTNTSGTFRVLLGNGDGTFRAGASGDSNSSNANALAVADMNGDGKPDVITAYFSTVTIFLGKGDGTFQEKTGRQGVDTTQIWVGDFNGDGKPDVAVSGSYSNVGIMLGNGDGTLGPVATFGANNGSYVSVAAAADLDGDGKLDLLAGNTQSLFSFLGGAPAGLAISVTHSGGKFLTGQTGRTYLIATSNPGFTAVTGAVLLADTLPAGLHQPPSPARAGPAACTRCSAPARTDWRVDRHSRILC